MITKTRIAGLLTALICGALILFGVLGGLMPQLAAAEGTNAQIENTKTLNDASRIQLAVLQQAGENSGELEASLEELRTALPETAASAAWLDELREIEKASKAQVNGFSVVDPLQGDQQQAAAQQPPADGANAAGEGASTAGAGAQTSAGAAESAPVASGVLPIPVKVEIAAANRKSATEFMRRLQTGSRLFLVKKVRIYEDKEHDPIIWRAVANGSLFTFTGN